MGFPLSTRNKVIPFLHKWWFVPLILLPQLIPPYTQTGYRIQEWGIVNAHTLTHSIKSAFAPLYPVFQVLVLSAIITLILFKNRIARVFSVFVALSYISMGFLQSISVYQPYGLAICTANVVTCFVLAGLWFWEALRPRNNFTFQPQPIRLLWPVPLALLAFWEPVNHATLLPDFNPLYLLTSGTGIVFCLVTPLYLTLILFQLPTVNIPLLGATSFISIFLALGNFLICFVIYPTYWWVGILHLPLLVIGVYGLQRTLAHSSVRQTARM